jgi:hypothetical protein
MIKFNVTEGVFKPPFSEWDVENAETGLVYVVRFYHADSQVNKWSAGDVTVTEMMPNLFDLNYEQIRGERCANTLERAFLATVLDFEKVAF